MGDLFMKKVIIYSIIAAIAIGIGFFIGSFVPDEKSERNYIAKDAKVTYTNIVKDKIKEVDEIPTSVSEEKVSPNTQIIEQIYYEDCAHIIETPIKDIDNYINMTKIELERKFPNWEIKEFSQDKVILYREEKDFCNEHFLVKNEDGYVTIYTINNEAEILELLDRTDISVQYLADVDKDNLEKGMIIYTKENLNKLIEDFE